MREEFEKLAAAGKISRAQIEPLTQLAEKQFAVHRSWGVGKVANWDWLFSKLVIDFQGRAGHAMDLAFAAESLKPVPADHILAQKFSDLQSLRQMAALDHLKLIRLVIESFGGKATLDQIQHAL